MSRARSRGTRVTDPPGDLASVAGVGRPEGRPGGGGYGRMRRRWRPGLARGPGLLRSVLLRVAAGGCGGRGSHRVIRLPVADGEWVAVGGETRPGLWLFPGDSVTWRLPAGPALGLQGGYLVPLPVEQKAEVLEIAVEPATDKPVPGVPAGAG